MSEIYAIHNSRSLSFRRPFGAVTEGTEVTLCLEAEELQEAFLELVSFKGHSQTIAMSREPLERQAGLYRYTATIRLQERGLTHYLFVMRKNGQTFYYGNNPQGLGGEGIITRDRPRGYQITVYKDFEVPAWYREGIIYQIFVDRFANGNEQGRIDNPKKNSFLYGNWSDEPMYIKNSQGEIARWDFFGGNLKGVIKKLPFIKSLGVTTIYLNPIFEAVSNHKYDAADYKSIDPMFGNDEIFKELCDKAKELGIHIVLDGVFSHTGSDSIYFNRYGNYPELGAYQSKDSRYYSWYRFHNHPDSYESWWGFKNQPNVEELNPDYMNYIIRDEDSVISKWMSLGASGWRLDVADELPDEFIKVLKARMKELKDSSVLIGEVWEDASNKTAYNVNREYFFGEELDSVTGYPFRDAIIAFLKGEISSRDIEGRLMSLYENYPKEAFYSSMNVLGTHDTARILTVLENHAASSEGGRQLLKLAVAFQMTFPGVPLIYYGDEAGVTGEGDPNNRRTYPWGRENDEILSYYKKLTAIRSSQQVFTKGDLSFHPLEEDLIAFERTFENDTALVLINRSMENKFIELRLNKEVQTLTNLLSPEEKISYGMGILSTRLGPQEVKILINK